MSTSGPNYSLYLIKEPFKVTGGFYINGVFNSLVVVDGKNYRKRVEILVTQGRKVFLAFKPGSKDYEIPGGSSERNIPDAVQVIHECQEEAGFTPKNIQYRLTHKVDYDEIVNKRPAWMNRLPILYDGVINVIYTGEFDAPYYGRVDDVDRDDLIAHGNWYDISQVKNILKDQHRKALPCLRR